MSQDINSIILNNLPYSIWVKDPNGRYIFVNSQFCKYYNLSKDNILYKTDSEIFNENSSIIFPNTDICNINEQSSKVFLIPTSNSNLKCYKKPLYNENKLIGILGSFIDISGITNESDLQAQKDFLQTIFDAIPDVIFYKDVNSVYIGCNQNCANDITESKDINDVIGKTDLELHPNKEMAKKFIERDKAIMKSRAKEITHVTIKSKSKGERYMENIKAPLILKDGTLIGIVGISRDISYRKKLEDKLYNLSYTDYLTNLYNRTYFVNRKEALHKKEYLPLSVIMGDINGLKIVNDSLGHIEGDHLIINISNIIKSCCRETDYIFRWGGDEIIILLPNTSEDEANEIISNIYKKCEEYKGSKIPLSISLGSSTITTLGLTIEEALKDAEDKVYRHKLLQNESFRSALINTLQRSLLEKSEETEQHTLRLQKYAVKIGKDLKLSPAEIDDIILLCNLHDIGKIGISESILKKTDTLTPDEYELMKLHCEKGYRITERIPELSHISKAILTHHERWDGTGYPLKLKGDEIPLISRIVSVVDAYDAMINDRIYRSSISKESALEEIKLNSGSQFDPTIVESFLRII